MRNSTSARRTWCVPLLAFLAIGCAAEEPAPAAEPAPSTTLAISADLFNGSVSLLDLDALVASDGSRDAALIEQVPLAPPGQQGPLTLAITADGTRAVVLLSQGVLAFVGGRLGVDTDNLPDTGAGVVVLDVVTRQVVGELPSTDLPIMVAIDETRNRAFVSYFGGADVNGAVAVYDLASLDEVDRFDVSPFVEGLALNDAGTRGAVIGASAGLYLFDPADLSGSLSETPLRLADDSSGVAFISGTERVVVANTRNPSNYVIIDASDLAAPKVIDEGEALDAMPFMVAAVPNREEVVLPLSRNDSLRFLHLDVSQTPARILHDIEVPDVLTFPEAVTVSPDGRYAFVGAEVSKELLIVDLVDGRVQRRPWLAELGPTALAVVP
jgi:DNA-binding beta-propeller fold protein YncE